VRVWEHRSDHSGVIERLASRWECRSDRTGCRIVSTETGLDRTAVGFVRPTRPRTVRSIDIIISLLPSGWYVICRPRRGTPLLAFFLSYEWILSTLSLLHDNSVCVWCSITDSKASDGARFYLFPSSEGGVSLSVVSSRVWTSREYVLCSVCTCM